MARPLRPQARARVIPTLLEVTLALAATPAEALAGGAPAASSSCELPAAPAATPAPRREKKAPDARRAAAGHDAEAAAAAMTKEARAHYEVGRKEEAAALLRQAYALYPTPRAALALARWERESKQPARAVAILDDMLRDAALTPAERDEASKLVDELRAGLGEVWIDGPADVAYRLEDGREVFGGDLVWLEPGPHVVVGPGGQRLAFTATIGASVHLAVAPEVPRIEPPLGGAPPPPPPSAGCACRKEPSYAGGGHLPESVAAAAMGLVIARRKRRR